MRQNWFLLSFAFRNKNRGKSIRKRIQASFRRKSARDKQKKLDQKHHCELDYSIEKSEAATPTPQPSESSAIQVKFEKSPQPSSNRKTSAFLTVDESLRHLSISGGEASSTEEEEHTG